MELGISKLFTSSSGPMGGAFGGPMAPPMSAPGQQPPGAEAAGQQDGGDFSGEALGQVAEVVCKVAMGAIKGLLSAFGGGDEGGGGGGIPGVGGGGAPGGGGGGGSEGIGSGGGGGGGGSAPMSTMASPSSGVTGGGANASVDMAKQYLGNSSISLKGKLANFSAAGGTGNNCADFVSAILANTQGFKKKPEDANVATFAKNLQAQGWQKVDKSQSRPGDVVIINGSQHTELVTKAGGTEAIGSNGGATDQKIGTDSLSGSGKQEFYQKR